MNFDELENIDKIKTKMLKYIMYKKRTENEVRRKFSDIDENILEIIIQQLKENNYINDENYIQRAVNEFMNLNNFSIKELIYKLQSKGINRNVLENYMSNKMEDLIEYEKKSAKNIFNKKSSSMEYLEIKQYLLKKGYKEESIKELM